MAHVISIQWQYTTPIHDLGLVYKVRQIWYYYSCYHIGWGGGGSKRNHLSAMSPSIKSRDPMTASVVSNERASSWPHIFSKVRIVQWYVDDSYSQQSPPKGGLHEYKESQLDKGNNRWSIFTFICSNRRWYKIETQHANSQAVNLQFAQSNNNCVSFMIFPECKNQIVQRHKWTSCQLKWLYLRISYHIRLVLGYPKLMTCKLWS